MQRDGEGVKGGADEPQQQALTAGLLCLCLACFLC